MIVRPIAYIIIVHNVGTYLSKTLNKSRHKIETTLPPQCNGQLHDERTVITLVSLSVFHAQLYLLLTILAAQSWYNK